MLKSISRKPGTVYGRSRIVDSEKLIEVQNKLKNLSGIIGIYDVTGDTDSMLVVACENSSEFNKLIKKSSCRE